MRNLSWRFGVRFIDGCHAALGLAGQIYEALESLMSISE
jgi:hypothetical protein